MMDAPESLTVSEKIELFEGPVSGQRRRVGALHVCSQGPNCNAVPISYVATKDIGERSVHDHKTGKELRADLVKLGRETERANMLARHLYDLVHISQARGKKVRSMWLDEGRSQDGEPVVRSRCVAMEFNMYDRLDVYAGTPPLKFIKMILSRAAHKRRNGIEDYTRVLGFYDVVTAFWHADLPLDEPIAVIPPRGEELDGYVWQMRKAMYGTRRASQLFLEFMVTVFIAASYRPLAVSRQVFYSERHDSMAALHGDDVIIEAEGEDLDKFDIVMKEHCSCKIMPRIGPNQSARMGRYLKRYICYIPGMGYEWNEDPAHVQKLLQSTGKQGARPQLSPMSKDAGKSDPLCLDALEAEAATRFRSDTGSILYVSSGRFDLQHASQTLSELMSKPIRLGFARVERCARYLAGSGFLALVFRHEPEPTKTVVIVDSNWSEEPDRYSTHAGCEFLGSHLIESYVAKDQVRSLSSGEAELYGIVDGAARGIMTRNALAEIGMANWPVEICTDSSAAIGMCSRTGVGKVRHIATRWLWVQDAVREKQITLKKVDGATNVADMGTKSLEPKRFQELMKLLPLAPPTCKRFLAVLAALTQTGAAKAASQTVYFDGEEERLQTSTRQDDFVDSALKLASSLAIIALTVIVSLRTYHSFGRPTRNAAAQCDPIDCREIACQSQCTYTAVRKEVGNFRFQPLPENSHGSW